MAVASVQYELGPADLRVVLALARRGTLAAAGELLGVDASTVFRALQRVEKGLQQRLFERTRAGYRPSELGAQLARHAERIETELDTARGIAQAPGQAVSGTVRISTTDTLLHGLVLPALRDLSQTHPLLSFEINASHELASLTKRDADIALRATLRPPDHVVGKHLGTIRVAIYGARTRGRKPDPATSPWIAPDEALPQHQSVLWRKRHMPGIVPRVQVNSILSVAEGIAAGLGVGVLPLFLARDRSDLVALTEPLADAETQLWSLTHPESRHLRRIATVAQHLAGNIALPD
ncbi:LysR family transcriptional regulator [Lysobacter sp. 2RAF19]